MDWEATIYARRLVGENEPYFATSYPVKADLARPCCLPPTRSTSDTACAPALRYFAGTRWPLVLLAS
jgi:hypothetical protein